MRIVIYEGLKDPKVITGTYAPRPFKGDYLFWRDVQYYVHRVDVVANHNGGRLDVYVTKA